MVTSASLFTDSLGRGARAALIRAGGRLLAERPLDAVTIDDIVLAAEVARGSFYNHFTDKTALASAVAEAARAALQRRIGALNEGVEDPAERIARALCAAACEADKSRSRAQLVLVLMRHGPEAAGAPGLRADLAAGFAAGRFRGLGFEAALLLALGAFQVAILRALQPAPARHASLTRQLAFGLLRGLGVDPASARAVSARAIAATPAAPERPPPSTP